MPHDSKGQGACHPCQCWAEYVTDMSEFEFPTRTRDWPDLSGETALMTSLSSASRIFAICSILTNWKKTRRFRVRLGG